MSTHRFARMALVLMPLLAVCSAAAAAEDPDLAPPTNKLERFQLRHANCKWTNEMGAYMYECLKANFNMNAHWCHNEAMDVFCTRQEEEAKAAAAKPADVADKPAN